jgi:hypothetical protein
MGQRTSFMHGAKTKPYICTALGAGPTLLIRDDKHEAPDCRIAFNAALRVIFDS